MPLITLYGHDGSKNHGCEAIVRGTAAILHPLGQVRLISFNKEEDAQFGLDKTLPILQAHLKRTNAYAPKLTLRSYLKRWIKKHIPLPSRMFLQKHIGMKNYRDIARQQGDLFMSIGGDVYCYDSYAVLDYLNSQLSKHAKTALWGCSITPQRIEQDKNLRADLNRYSFISARESITFEALLKNGISKNTHLFPDPAFVLEAQPTELPPNFLPGNTVGVNLSPMVQNLERGDNLAYKNVKRLIEYILHTTDMNVCLIAHVLWQKSNDLVPLTALYEEFKDTGRVSLVGKSQNCSELKYIVSKCRFVVAARTHASIAAYSTQVPTLVIGYSVKARGIARDIFGTEDGYVLPIQQITAEDELTKAFSRLQSNEAAVRARYQAVMPGYIARAYLSAKEIQKLLNN